MTIDIQRLTAIDATREWLYEKLEHKGTPPKTKKEILQLLHHYPWQLWTDDLRKLLDKKELWRILQQVKK